MDEIADAIGEAAARDLARQFGGTGLYVPRTIGSHHPICVAIGRDAADRLAAWAGGSAISIPKQAELRARVLEMRKRSLTIVQIARETGYSERHVYRLLREEDDYRQPQLFD
ncbi:helix-turn-helix domain-containing protein [uncultured Sphingomonas sp.]|uniref:helix-turn-helix domain-containing protein n=1 Tax=uncultured Sphingomonas sp. TaxID=158754 RepID=UPI0025CBF9FA|nr:helix-turn-helix domain-containing protein [uncultured Sphingomonas sp.]